MAQMRTNSLTSPARDVNPDKVTTTKTTLFVPKIKLNIIYKISKIKIMVSTWLPKK